MGQVRVDVPDDHHTGIKNIKNNNEDRPDTVKGCVLEAIAEYVDRHEGRP